MFGCANRDQLERNFMGEEIRCKLQQIGRNQLIQNFSLEFEEFESCLLENNWVILEMSATLRILVVFNDDDSNSHM